jgi:hypothetical protein
VNTALQQGDYAGAQAAAVESKKWSKLALIVGLCVYGLSILCCVGYFVVLGGMLASSNTGG